jgi:hypothetical protein
MNDGSWRRLIPRRARVGLVLLVAGGAVIAFALTDPQVVWKHPVFRSSERAARAFQWCLNSEVPQALHLGGWALVLMGVGMIARSVFEDIGPEPRVGALSGLQSRGHLAPSPPPCGGEGRGEGA